MKIEDYKKDIERLAELCHGKIGLLKLLGGEPLLHEKIVDFMRIARESFPDACIQVFSNGILLCHWSRLHVKEIEIWDAVKKYDIQLNITRYPIDMDESEIVTDAIKNGIDVVYTPPEMKKRGLIWICDDFAHKDESVKNMIRFPIDIKRKQKKYEFVCCHLFNSCIVLRKGRLYTCPRRAYIDLFEQYFDIKLDTEQTESIDIFSVNSIKDISNFLSERIPFCDYCALKDQTVHYWKRSTKRIEEWLQID